MSATLMAGILVPQRERRKTIKFGLALPHYDTSFAGKPVSWEAVARIALQAERAGLDSVWVSDHLFLDWSKYGGDGETQGSLECWTTLSALAGVTERVRIGSLALCNDLRNPALLAKMAATLDLLSGGRLEVGMGAGWYEPEFTAAGIPFDPARIRIERLREAVEIVSRLLEGEVLDFDGEHYKLKGARCRPLPADDGRPAIWVGGKGDRVLATAARSADGWNLSWLGQVGAYRERSQAADRACETEGRDPASLRRSVGAYVLVGRDDRDLDRRFRRLVERTPAGVLSAAPGASAVSWDQFRGDRIAGSVGEVVDRLGELKELDVEEVVTCFGAVPFQLAAEDDVELFATEVAPALR
jgi:alkanesulfonate monooxygenase SsuD/methylene tetrahydromethanopterin reductase-like flavin-dependent oxidoreductase (luciferase family)